MGTLILIIRSFFYRTDGVTAIEYALIAALIALVIIGAVTIAGQQVAAVFNDVAAALQ